MKTLSIALLVAGCGATSARRAPAEPPTPTPAEVGLPDEPTPEPAAAPPRASGAPRLVAAIPYLRREECPRVRGCSTVRTITRERATTTIDCGRGAGYGGATALRQLADVVAVADGGLAREVVVHGLRRVQAGMRACFDAEGVAAHVDLQFTIVDGRATAIAGPDCLRAPLAAAAFPREPGLTAVTWSFDYRVIDPDSVPPLSCARD